MQAESKKPETLSRWRFDAVILDLDGVLTRTKDLHARSWKLAFDELLEARAGGRAFEPFRIDPDYYEHVDGKPRCDGAASVLRARGIELPWGRPDDPPGSESVCGLGNRKNQLFLDLLARDGVDTYASARRFVEALRRAGFKTAIVSSSKNCVPVLEAAGALELFDAKIDGEDLEARSLAGKPAPDTFLAAAAALGVPAERSVVVEDAVSGVAAGRAGGFGAVIGVDRGAKAEALRAHGADIVVKDLSEIDIAANAAGAAQRLEPETIEPLLRCLGTRQPAWFLDFDGTLTPIVDRPKDAVLSEPMREILRRIAARHRVAIVSGRDLTDIKTRVGLKHLVYAGSHGFDIALPDGRGVSPAAARAALPALDSAERALEQALADVGGVLVERKRFAIAVHYRLAAADAVDGVERIVDRVRAQHDCLRKRGGKKIFELMPDIEWDKGRAVLWLLDVLKLDPAKQIPIYIGDDVTDEDAFAAIGGRGLGIVVDPSERGTSATFRLDDTDAVQTLLDTFSKAGPRC